jgi:(1->4)-alpha-D-glucan 1-alpha-D-glucosylmutase
MGLHVRATYRVQLTPAFDLDRAAAIVPYLARLGISHLYASPLAQATAGSTHGYDVTDHHRVRDELGGDAALQRLWQALDRHAMGMVVDIVPNHMGVRDPSNGWWQDVLRHGPGSRYATYFDIDWSPPNPASTGKVVLPFLDRPLDEALRDGVIRVQRRSETIELEVCHHGDRWPASDESLALLGLGPGDCAERIEGAIEGLHRSPSALARFLAAQHWRPVHWREAPALLNWRRFFDVTDLAAVRVDRPEVFDDVHALLRGWLADDALGARVVQGVRVDHIDGLVDPERYLLRLRELVGADRLLVVEKILAADEKLPRSWPVDGTTGYEVIAHLDEALTDPVGAVDLQARYTAFTGIDEPWPELQLRCKRVVADRLLAPEVDRLARGLLDAIAEAGPPDGARPSVETAREVMAELAAELGVYRTYARPGSTPLGDADRRELDRAAARTHAHRPDLDPSLVDLAHALLTGGRGDSPALDALAARFGQLTAPLAAKAVEDTAFYRAVSLPWLTEVGGDPGRSTVGLDDVRAALTQLAHAWPGTFSPSTTHDTKRSGDVRARLSRLAADPGSFAEAVAGWHEASGRHRTPDGPDRAMEWLLWTTLVGAWPIGVDRMAAFATKAMREAKVHTSWTDPDAGYEDAVQAFVAGVLADDALTASIDRFVATVRSAGRAASLAQVVLTCTAVGSPDIYQGDEVWNLSLVDPDNRRPVDHRRLDALLGRIGPDVELTRLWAGAVADPDDEGLVKLALWHRLLSLRAEQPDAFTGTHRALAVEGTAADGILAFTRGGDVAVVVPVRSAAPVPLAAGSVELPTGRWRDVVTGAELDGGPTPVAGLLDAFPVAVLARA